MECDVDEPYMADEAQMIYELAASPESRIAGVIAAARPEHADFDKHLDSIANTLLKGIRRVLHVVPDNTIEMPGFIDRVRTLEKRSLSFDICVLDRQLTLAERLIRECPQVSFVLDHCGNPRVAEGGFDEWAIRIREIARHDNVVCKLSGIVTNARRGNWTVSDLEPFISFLVDSFGCGRLVFGTDWPVCTLNSTLKDWVHSLEQILSGLTSSERGQIFAGNARSVYRLN